MPPKVEVASPAGFCYGVRRAVEILVKTAGERGQVEALGAIVHNQYVFDKLEKAGARVIDTIDEITAPTAAIGAHGVGRQVEAEIRSRHIEVVDTTCPFVKRAQVAARRMSEAGLFIIVFGDINHPEVKGILGWTDGNSVATLDQAYITKLEKIPRRIGLLSQTTQVPDKFTTFAEKVVHHGLLKDSEIRIVDTICHDIRDRQQAALDLAKRVDLMLVIGSHTSANTNHLAELCATVAETRLIESVDEIDPEWLKLDSIGVTAGASTSEETINEVLERLRAV